MVGTIARLAVCLLLAVAVAACGGRGGDDTQPAPGPTNPSTVSSTAPTNPDARGGGGAASPGAAADGRSGSSPSGSQPTDPPVEPGHTNPPREAPRLPEQRPPDRKQPPAEKSIIVAGPTLSNDYPDDWGLFPDAGRRCAYLTFPSEHQQPLKVAKVSVPAPWRPATGEPQCGQLTAQETAGASYCLGHVFSPGSESGCKLEIELPQSARGHDWYGAELVITLETTCPNRQGDICRSVPAELKPSPAAPVRVRLFDADGLKACLATVPDPDAQSPDQGELFRLTDAQCRLPTGVTP